MSHLAVLVITDEDPSEKVIERTLQPWHEFDGGDDDDQYVIDVDVTDEVEDLWKQKAQAIKMPDGTLHSRYNDIFYTAEPTDDFRRRLGRKEFELPAGAVELDVPRQVIYAAKGENKIDFAEEYGGWTYKNGRFFNHTNPNAKWDWWQIGGRYSGRLQVSGNKEGRIGTRSWTNKDEYITGVDQARRGDLDLAAMIKRAQNERRQWAEDCCSKAERTMDELDIACRLNLLAHDLWLALDDPKPRGPEYRQWLEDMGGEWPILVAFNRACFELPDVPKNVNLTEWIDNAPALTAWAVIHDNQWFEKGSMGWFGMSSGDKHDWDHRFNELWDFIAANQWVSIVDCHV